MAVHQTRDDRVETVLELAGSLQAGVETSVSLCERYLARIHRKDHDLHAFITVDAAFVLSEAARLDEERSKGIYRGLLHGIPIGIKDSIATAGIRTTFNSRFRGLDSCGGRPRCCATPQSRGDHHREDQLKRAYVGSAL